jgi:hypothetical protein
MLKYGANIAPKYILDLLHIAQVILFRLPARAGSLAVSKVVFEADAEFPGLNIFTGQVRIL